MPQGRQGPEDNSGPETIRRFPDESGEMALQTPRSGDDHRPDDPYPTVLQTPTGGGGPLPMPPEPGRPATPAPPSGTGTGIGTGTGTGTGTGGSFIERGEVAVEPGQVIFRKYLVLEKLGGGGMGEVWLVEDQVLDVKRALKMITRSTAFDSEARARFRREARAMAKFSHPNVIGVFDAHVDQRDTAYIVMEYAPGESLEKVIRPRQPMSLEWTLAVLTQLCEALHVAHGKGIIHRDLKPSNLMLVPDDMGGKRLKVFDFGIAKFHSLEPAPHDAQDARTMVGAFMGTPPYASPEQAVGEAEPRSDIYSVGVILYEFLTGHRPFSGKPPMALIMNTIGSPPPAFAEVNPEARVPPEVERVVMRCLSKTPDGRPQSPLALLAEFKAALPTLELEPAATKKGPVEPELPEPRTARRARPRRGPRRLGPGIPALAAALGLVALGLVALGAGLYLARGGGSQVVEVPPAPPPPTPPVPHVIVDGRAYDLFGGKVYLPTGYQPVDPTDLDPDGYPRALTRDGVRFLRIPGGRFLMGARDGDVSDLNTPAREVSVPGFYLQKYEATNRELQRFVDEFGDRFSDPNSSWRTWYDRAIGSVGTARAEKLPAQQVPWRLATDFALKRGGHLPSEAQWEYAARSCDSARVLVWDSRLDQEKDRNRLANVNRDAAIDGVLTVAGDAYEDDRTRQGVVALAGNVREWCRDPWVAYDAMSPGGPPGLPAEPPPKAEVVVRGGSYDLDNGYCLVNRRQPGVPLTDPAARDIGFRIVLECPPVRPPAKPGP